MELNGIIHKINKYIVELVIQKLLYLIMIWVLVIAMYARRSLVQPGNQRVANLFMKAFALLALGDTGHVGFRVVAYALGDLQATISVSGMELGLVGLGALATAINLFKIRCGAGSIS